MIIVARDGPTVELGGNGPLKFFYLFFKYYYIWVLILVIFFYKITLFSL